MRYVLGLDWTAVLACVFGYVCFTPSGLCFKKKYARSGVAIQSILNKAFCDLSDNIGAGCFIGCMNGRLSLKNVCKCPLCNTQEISKLRLGQIWRKATNIFNLFLVKRNWLWRHGLEWRVRLAAIE